MQKILVAWAPLEGGAFLLGFLHVAVAAAVTVHVLMFKRDVPAAIGWIGLAWLSPFLGALLYVGFGVNRVRRRAHRLMGSARSASAPGAGHAASDAPLERLAAAVGRISGRERAAGSVAAVLDCGDEAYPQMLAAIDGAQSSIRLCSYIFRADEAGRPFIEALARAHRRGVAVRVLIDGVGGGFLLSPAWRLLRRKGVPAARFLHTLLPWRMPFLDLRMHKKILAVDGVCAFVGGLNIGAENVLALRPASPVRDVHFRLEGPAIVRQIEHAFDDDWAFATGKAPPSGVAAPAAAPSRAVARAISAGPDQEVDQLVLVFLAAINQAQRSIRIATPYFLPDEQIVTALGLAAFRGVDVRIVLPGRTNHRLVAWAAPAHIRPLLVAGCRIWRSPPPFDHAKLMTIDGAWSLIGSANWDVRSLRLNFELAVEVYDAELSGEIARIVDARCARPLTLQEIEGRPYLVKLRDAAARLTSPYI